MVQIVKTRLALLVALLACLAGAMLIVSCTQVLAAEYAGRLDSSCCNREVIESGATEKQYIEVSNIGTATWGAPGTDSVDVGPEKAGSPKGEFATGDWTTVNGEPRALAGVSAPVPPGASYKFVFEVKAPTVAQQTTFTEHFGLAIDAIGSSTWMKGTDAVIEYTVVPAVPPTITIAPSVTSIAAGGSFTVNASATSVASVNHIVISFGGTNVTSTVTRDPEGASDEANSWTASASFSAAGTGSGLQTVIATAYDDAGLSTTAIATVQVEAPPGTNSNEARSLLVDPIRMYFAGLTVPKHPDELHLRQVVILGTRSGERVTVLCQGCRGPSRLGPALAKGAEVRFRPRRLLVTRRSQLTVYVMEAGLYGRYKMYSINVSHVSLLAHTQGCLLPGGRSHTACPR